VLLREFDFDLPRNLIAQRPLSRRDGSRLMVLSRPTGRVNHRAFPDLVGLLSPGDVIIVNNTKVRPCRLFGRKPGGGRAEVLLIRNVGGNRWEALVKGLSEGSISFGASLSARVSGKGRGMRMVEFDRDPGQFVVENGAMPLPPYIKRMPDKQDTERYQTIYASKEGAIAAPTAGLHFTDGILGSLFEKGIGIHAVTLHVGLGTFSPVTVSDIRRHSMEQEHYEIPTETAEAVNEARERGNRIVAVGTTVTRTLETAFAHGRLRAGEGGTSLFIYPGYSWRVVDALLTNFHLPKATPLMLVSAFAGLEAVRRAYMEAVRESYRFFSYGDAMLVL